MIRVFIITLYAFFLMGISLTAQANGDTEKPACAWNEAEYVPSLDYKAGEPPLSYKLIVQPNKDIVGPQWGPNSIFTLQTFDAETGELANTLKMYYGCSGGSVPGCSLRVSEDTHDVLYVQVLNKFSSLGHTNGSIPYALIIPNTMPTFGHLNWSKITSISYQLKGVDTTKPFNKNFYYRPNFSVPSVWVFDQCVNHD